MANQSHSGSGDNVGGNKVLNLSLPKIVIVGIIIFLSIIAFAYWKSLKERFFFNEDKIDLAISIVDSLQIRGLNEQENVTMVFLLKIFIKLFVCLFQMTIMLLNIITIIMFYPLQSTMKAGVQ